LFVSACGSLGPSEWLDAVFDDLLRTGELVSVGPNIGPADAQPKLTKNQQMTRAKILELIAAAGLAPPNVKELAVAVGQKPEAIVPLLTLCVEDGLLIRVSDDQYFTPSAIDTARRICRQTFDKLGAATLSQLRESWGITRKHAVPLGEYFDAQSVTLRDGDIRRPGPKLLPSRSA